MPLEILTGPDVPALLARAQAFQTAHTQRADDYAAFSALMDGRPGFVVSPWCGTAECEAQIKTVEKIYKAWKQVVNGNITPLLPGGPRRVPRLYAAFVVFW